MAPLPGDYQEPDEVEAGQPVPAESFNKYGNSIIWLKNKIGDSSTFDDIAPTSTRGDLIVRGASANQRLAIGGGAQFLMSTGEMPQWQVLDPYLNMSAVESGQLPVAHGGTGSDLSETGGSGHVLKQASEGADITVGPLEASDIPNLDASKLASGQVPVARGGTGANLSSTGGAGQVLKQSSAGGAVTVGALAASDIPSLDTSKLTTGSLPVARGGTGQSSAPAALIALSPTNTRGDLIVRGATEHERLSIGGAGRFLRSNGTDPSWQLLTASDIPDLAASKITSGQLPVARGGTGADLSATGGSGQVLKQSSTGADVTVGALVASDIPDLDAAKITSGQLSAARGGVPSGTAFPGSPSAGDRFFRTDAGFECYYDGSRWLTTCEFVVPIVSQAQYSTNADTSPVLISAVDTFRITRITMSTLVLATNNGSNYWSIALQGVNDAFTAFTVVMTANTASQAANAYTRSTPTASDPQLAAGRAALRLGLTKTGSPGDLRIMLTVHYRFVLT